MFKYLFVLTVSIAIVSGQTWVNRADLKNFLQYWQTLMQEMFNEVEAREWCNLKLIDITTNIDDNLYNMHVNGTVNYTNGFVVSIQKIEITNIQRLITSRTINGEAVPFGTVRGVVNFRDLLVGFDVTANLVSPEGVYRTTGTFLHSLVTIQLDMTQNLITKEFSSSPSVLSTSAGSGVRMNYMPSSNITEALSRRFSHSTFSSARLWAENTFVPIMLNIATNRLVFPEVCFSDCA